MFFFINLLIKLCENCNFCCRKKIRNRKDSTWVCKKYKMSQFSHINDIQSLMIMDGELKRGQAPRWMKKADASLSSSVLNNTSMNASKLSVSYNQYSSNSNNKTPNKNSQATKKTPGKSPSRKTITPNKNAKTPTGGDRFIPNRATTNFELGHYMVRSLSRMCFVL